MDEVSIDYVDRHFLYRGIAALAGTVGICLALFFLVAIFHAVSSFMATGKSPGSGGFFYLGVVVFIVTGFIVFTYRYALAEDIFRYQYYPIRFDRVEQQVHVFVGGHEQVVSVPWNDVKFVIGRDKPFGAGEEGYTYDLRGLILRGDQVIRTFAVGSDSGQSPAITLAHWEMIRHFMESGPSALPFPPLQLYTSVEPSFRNAFIIHFSSAGAGMMWIMLPFTLLWAIFRFLAMKLCRKPVWPQRIQQAASKSEGTVLHAPLVYGRVDHTDGRGDEMERFWKESISAAKARDPAIREQLRAGESNG